MTHFSTELRELKGCKDDLQRNTDSLVLEAKKVKVSTAKIEKDGAILVEKFVYSMIKNTHGLRLKRRPHSVFPAETSTTLQLVQGMKSQLEELNSDQDVLLAKKINKNVKSLIGKAEAE
jgi:hypothetical protein